MRGPGRRLWRTLLTGAVIGLVESAGLDLRGRLRRRPLRIVWIDDREPGDPLAGTGVWFLDPLRDPSARAVDGRRPHGRSLRLARLRLAAEHPHPH